MLLTKHTKITIDSSPEEIWDYAHSPDNWTASNPEEHLGLEFFNKENRPDTGTRFRQQETVAGFYADLRGHILYVEKPKVLVWRGVATYKILGGLLRPRIPEGGVVKLEKARGGYTISHDVYMDFPDTISGKILYWFFTKIYKGEEAVYNHTFKELEFFKRQLEPRNKNS